jgi:hypothetical protein
LISHYVGRGVSRVAVCIAGYRGNWTHVDFPKREDWLSETDDLDIIVYTDGRACYNIAYKQAI